MRAECCSEPVNVNHATFVVDFRNAGCFQIAVHRANWNGDKRILANPFDGMGLLDQNQDRRRVARSLPAEELTRSHNAARARPLGDAQVINQTTLEVARRRQKVAVTISRYVGTASRIIKRMVAERW